MDKKRHKLSIGMNDGQAAEIAALKQKLVHMEAELKMVIAELEQVKEERARDKINFEAEKCALESKIDKCKEQCTELQSENEKLQSENEKLQSQNEKFQSENVKLQSENEKLQKFLQDLESAKINVEEKSPINLCNTDLNSQITKIMNNRLPQTSIMNPSPGIPRDYPYGCTPMPTSNPLYPSGVGFAPNMSASPHPSTSFTSGNRSNSSYPETSSSYLLAPNNPHPESTSPYPVISNNPYPSSTSYPASYSSLYPASVSPYLASSNRYYPASGSPYPASSNNRYPTSSNSPYPSPTSAYPCSSNRHYPATNSSYSGSTSMNQPPGASPYSSMGSRGYDNKFGPSVNETNDDALNINSLPNEIILKVFSYLTQNQLGQIARVCRRWDVLTKSPDLWRKVNVKIFLYFKDKNTVVKSFIDGLPSCVTFIRLDFPKREDLDFKELCAKLQQNCPHLEEIILTNLRMSILLPEVINFCTQFLQGVKKLVFQDCSFEYYSTRVELNNNSKIEVLVLYNCGISSSNRVQFSKFLYLKELRISSTEVDDTWFVGDTSFLNQLHVLDLGWTYITANTFLAIQRYGHNLKELYLCGFHLRDLNLSFTDSVFPRLKTICLSIYRVTCEVVISLIQSCPSLENVYVYEDVAKSFAEHPFVVANRCKSGIVKAINWDHNHDVDYSHN